MQDKNTHIPIKDHETGLPLTHNGVTGDDLPGLKKARKLKTYEEMMYVGKPHRLKADAIFRKFIGTGRIMSASGKKCNKETDAFREIIDMAYDQLGLTNTPN